MLAIEASDLKKRYGALQVLQGLTLRIATGEVYGLLALPLLPILGGFELAIQRDYTAAALLTLAGQALSIAVLIGGALIAFKRRELIFTA